MTILYRYDKKKNCHYGSVGNGELPFYEHELMRYWRLKGVGYWEIAIKHVHEFITTLFAPVAAEKYMLVG